MRINLTRRDGPPVDALAAKLEREAQQRARLLAEARLYAARRNDQWREIAEPMLVRRGPFLVHAETDELYLPYRGVVWVTGKASAIADHAALFYTVSTAGELTFLEKSTNPTTWAQVVEKQARRAAKAAA